MARVSIEADQLIVEIEGLGKLWALKSRLVIPLAHVRGATADPGIVKEPKGLRSPGTHFPGVITSGTYRTKEGQVFWDVRDAAKVIVIELTDERYTRLVLQVADPRTTVALVEAAIPTR
ncbi:hypothetical protein [Streptomyces albipurpureus]|uniref:Bacterial Pleckstrin homology domain-containing protein n=1 Tax=Streptomyces albipurpureus TaxID=2897419 RepID=A0ABT0ULJ1_9ACTN|nr:hypothetical protein [Streptomyces sp. CWNU-1]MCM2389488.1 hypothetical protein [Streptomyces sp. CWNU-1]